VINAISQISKVYEKEMNVRLVPTVIHIWKDAQKDPYRGNRNIYDLLALFNSTWNYQNEFRAIANQFDKALFMTSKSLQEPLVLPIWVAPKA
jgi:predicted glycosyltransferase